jgi:hypothetical protein
LILRLLLCGCGFLGRALHSIGLHNPAGDTGYGSDPGRDCEWHGSALHQMMFFVDEIALVKICLTRRHSVQAGDDGVGLQRVDCH